MKKKSLLLIVLSVLITSYFAWAKFTKPMGDQKVIYTPSKKDCFVSLDASWKYCIHIPATGQANGDVAYLLHGRNLDEHTWNDDAFYTGMIQEYWQQHQIVPPTVVTVSFGPVWFLTEKGQKEKSGLLDVFTENVIKEVEARTGKPKRRIVFGESMGGVNSLVLGMKAPHLFQKVAASCPAVYQMSPFASLEEIENFLKRTGADPKVIYGVIQLGKEYLANEDEWKKFSPLRLIDSLNPNAGPEFYSSCGLYDVYGNFEGNEILANRAKDLGIKWQWRPVYGGHCATDIASLAEFLAQ